MESSIEKLGIDEIDLRLLSLLQADASTNNQDLAAAVGVSPATALRRVRRLTDAGLIERRIEQHKNRVSNKLVQRSIVFERRLDHNLEQRIQFAHDFFR